MEFQYFGANCVKITTKKASIVIDDNLKDLGGKSITKPGDVVLFTSQKPEIEPEAKIVIADPGEYEVSDVSILGVPARAHIDEPEQQNATMYRLIVDDVRVAVIGHVFPELSEEQAEALGTIDVMFIPVGGNGFTLDGVGALKLAKEIEPKIIIPTHYADKALKYPVPAQSLDEALKGLAMEPAETLPKLKLKAADLADVSKLIVLEH